MCRHILLLLKLDIRLFRTMLFMLLMDCFSVFQWTRQRSPISNQMAWSRLCRMHMGIPWGCSSRVRRLGQACQCLLEQKVFVYLSKSASWYKLHLCSSRRVCFPCRSNYCFVAPVHFSCSYDVFTVAAIYSFTVSWYVEKCVVKLKQFIICWDDSANFVIIVGGISRVEMQPKYACSQSVGIQYALSCVLMRCTGAGMTGWLG